MEKELKRNILLGFFILVGIILFITGIFLIGSKSEIFKKTFPITAKFSNAIGLKLGSNVRYNGVKVGIVKSVDLINDTLVQVDMSIEEEKRHFIHSNAIASIASDGLMGDKIVNIIAGKGGDKQVKDNDLLVAHNPLNTDHVLETLSQSNENIKVITDNLKTLTSEINSNNGPVQLLYKNPEMAKQLKHSFSNLDAITSKVLNVSATLQQLTSQIQKGNGALNTMINDTALANNISYTFDKLKATSDELIKASGNLNQTIQYANSGKGTLNMLLTDTTFAATVQQSMANIKKASIGLDENMEAMKHNFLTRGYFRRQAKKNKNKSKTTGQ
jgi:phospholipid/cholesterol/gamma-HCH transport system substrate-binding protein